MNQFVNLLSQEDINQTVYLGKHILFCTIKVELCMYVTMLIAVPHYPDMIMAFVLSQTKSDLHLKNLRGKKKSRKFNRKQSLHWLPMFQFGRKSEVFVIFQLLHKTKFLSYFLRSFNNKIKEIIRNRVQSSFEFWTERLC